MLSDAGPDSFLVVGVVGSLSRPRPVEVANEAGIESTRRWVGLSDLRFDS